MNGNSLIAMAHGVADVLQDLSPEVLLAPEYDLSELATQRCVIVPVSRIEKRLSRNAKTVSVQHTIEVGLMFRAKNLDTDALVRKSEEISALLLNSKVRGISCINAEPNPLYDAEQIRERNQFTSVISVVYRELVS